MSNLAKLFATPPTLIGTNDGTLNSVNTTRSNEVRQQMGDNFRGTKLEVMKAEHPYEKNKQEELNVSKGEIKVNNGNNQTTGNKEPTKKKKKKKQNKRPKVTGYIDYDKKMEEDAREDSSSLWAWRESSTFTHRNFSSSAEPSAPYQREVISYEELALSRISQGNRSAKRHVYQNKQRRLRNQHGQQGNQQNNAPGQQGHQQSNQSGQVVPQPSQKNPQPHHQKNLKIGNGLSNKNKRSILQSMEQPSKIQKISDNGNITSGNPLARSVLSCDFLDPFVAATEKKEIFEKPKSVVDSKAYKPLTNKQKKKREKAKYYLEKRRQQLEKEKEYALVQKNQLFCRFFLQGKCSKGNECPYSHDTIPPKKQELCKFYIMSFCDKGSTCLYYHEDWPCKFFHVYRSCKHGDACRFSHQALTDETRPLLEKAVNDQNSNPSANVSPTNHQSSSVSETAIQGISGSDVPFSAVSVEHSTVPVDFSEQLVPFNGQFPNVLNTHEPWDKKLITVDLDENHQPCIPSTFCLAMADDLSSELDPRIKQYGLKAKSSLITGSLEKSDINNMDNGGKFNETFNDNRNHIFQVPSVSDLSAEKHERNQSETLSCIEGTLKEQVGSDSPVAQSASLERSVQSPACSNVPNKEVTRPARHFAFLMQPPTRGPVNRLVRNKPPDVSELLSSKINLPPTSS